MIVLLMGVAGSGKTVIGSALGRRHGIPFVDGDDLHPRENIQKMASGVALTDGDREPWLQSIREVIDEHAAADRPLIVACSALKESYRRQLLDQVPAAEVVLLQGARRILAERLAQRRGHFFDPQLLDAQLEALEKPRNAHFVRIDADPEKVVEAVEDALGWTSRR